MKEYARAGLNIIRLLELGDFDMRKIAEENPSLSADAYFTRVENFLKAAPELSRILLRVSELEITVKSLIAMEAKLGVSNRTLDLQQDTGILNDLERVKYTLLGLGYDKLDNNLDRILSAIKDGELTYAENIGVETFNLFNKICERANSTYSAKKAAKAQALAQLQGEDDSEEEDTSGQVSLSEALEYFDEEEKNRKLRILAVDDVSIVLNTITSVLSPYYEVFALKSASLVEKFLSQTTPELFLLDIEMSDMNGFELVPLIRSFEEHKDTPIIFLTGNASIDNLKGAIALGACDFITKPVKQDILLEKIEKNIVRKIAY